MYEQLIFYKYHKYWIWLGRFHQIEPLFYFLIIISVYKFHLIMNVFTVATAQNIFDAYFQAWYELTMSFGIQPFNYL